MCHFRQEAFNELERTARPRDIRRRVPPKVQQAATRGVTPDWVFPFSMYVCSTSSVEHTAAGSTSRRKTPGLPRGWTHSRSCLENRDNYLWPLRTLLFHQLYSPHIRIFRGSSKVTAHLDGGEVRAYSCNCFDVANKARIGCCQGESKKKMLDS